MRTILSLIAGLFITISLSAQSIKVGPYIQMVFPNRATIMWETNTGEESTVEWGLDESLGNETLGIAYTSQGGNLIHEVEVGGLDRLTKYYYRVRTGAASSAILSFKTPPFASDNESFRFVAMSDMQRDNAQPDKFNEMVNAGVIPYVMNSGSESLSDALGFVLIPGDLVVNGLDYSQWEEHFFDPGEELFNRVPVYPVPGNHEFNSALFFRYFKLPDNGPTQLEEHCWFHDYANVRIIGLDSNFPNDSQAQLNWLEEVLDQTCGNDEIDFVFAQLHHPHKSELWVPGESDFTGSVVSLLEDFSSNCEKPSIHFFGHTHAYSRGQSRDHKHLWVNVASAGGALDNWGEFVQADYEEFSVSYDEYGFVVMDVSGGENPRFVLKRISRGDENNPLNNQVKDSLMITRFALGVEQPIGLFPNGDFVIPDCIEMQGSAFIAQNEEHGQSHWQLTTYPGNFNNPIFESWRDYQNIYGDQDLQAGDDLSNERVYGLQSNQVYQWRVRYRDRELNWSEWSNPAVFTTMEALNSENLLINPGAEMGTAFWELEEGQMEALFEGECNGTSPYSGERYFVVGGLCVDDNYARAFQEVSLFDYASEIDDGILSVGFGGMMANWQGDDIGTMQVHFLNASNLLIGSTSILTNVEDEWTEYSSWEMIPEETRKLRIELTGTRMTGADNDCYFDDLFLRVAFGNEDCAQLSTQVSVKPATKDLLIYPNPFSEDAFIQFSNPKVTDVKVYDISGRLVDFNFEMNQNGIVLYREGQAAGIYTVVVFDGPETIRRGKFAIR